MINDIRDFFRPKWQKDFIKYGYSKHEENGITYIMGEIKPKQPEVIHSVHTTYGAEVWYSEQFKVPQPPEVQND